MPNISMPHSPGAPLNTDAWEFTRSEDEGENVRQVRSNTGQLGYIKPLDPVSANDVQAAKEFVTSNLAHEIGAHVPRFDLLHNHPRAGVSYDVPDTITYSDALDRPNISNTFQSIGPSIITHMLVGACDVGEENLLFHTPSETWYSIDHAQAFNTLGKDAIGRRDLAYGKKDENVDYENANGEELFQAYPDDVMEHLKGDTTSINAAYQRATQMSENSINRIVDSVPNSHISNNQREEMKRFIRDRKNNLHPIFMEWYNRVLQ